MIGPKNAQRDRHHAECRRGAVLVGAIICLVLVSLLMASLLKLAAMQRKQVTRWEYDLQAEWLAESAVERAVSQLGGDPNYAGEQWKVAGDELGTQRSGHVAIRVESPDETPGTRLVEVQATYPADAVDAVRRTKQLTVSIAGND